MGDCVFFSDGLGALRGGIYLPSNHVQGVGRGVTQPLGGRRVDVIVLCGGAWRVADGSRVVRVGGVVPGGETARRFAAVHPVAFMLQRHDAGVGVDV